MLNKIFQAIDSIILTLITNFEGQLGSKLRYHYYSSKLAKCSGYFDSFPGFVIANPNLVSIGKKCSFNRGVYINAGPKGRICIGDNVMVGPYTFMRSSNHIYGDVSKTIKAQGHVDGDIYIGNDVWVGGHVAILKGVKINDHSIVAAHSLVNKDVPPYEVYGGVPAKRIKRRK